MANEFQGNVGTIYVRNVPRAARDNFHAACVRRGKTMTSVLVTFIKEFGRNDHDPFLKTEKLVSKVKEKLAAKKVEGTNDKALQSAMGKKKKKIAKKNRQEGYKKRFRDKE